MATKSKTIRLDCKLIELLEKQAKEENRSLNNMIETILKKFFLNKK